MKKIIIFIIILTLVLGAVFITGCTGIQAPLSTTQQPSTSIAPTTLNPTTIPTTTPIDPIVGIWVLTSPDSPTQTMTFTSDNNYKILLTGFSTQINGKWSKIRENEYLIKYDFTNETDTYIYDTKTDTTKPLEFDVHFYRQGKEPSQTPTLKPTATKTVSTTTAPKLMISGNRKESKPFSIQNGGGYVALGLFFGEGNFIVHITDSNGYVVESLFNEIRSKDSDPKSWTKITHLDAGDYYLDVQANGAWAVEFSPA
jgi:hypothetical protein